MAVFRQNKPCDVPPCYTRFYALHMGNCLYELSGKRYAPSFLQGHPPSLRFGRPDVASGRDSYAGGSLNRCEAHPVLARQLRIRLHKALRSRTRGTENAHTLITHRLKQAQQLRGHVGCRQ